MQPHMKLLILDFVNYFMSLLSESDRKALIGDLSEQQKDIDAGVDEKKTVNSRRTQKDDLEFRTLQELNQ